jgi:hypothetical protein
MVGISSKFSLGGGEEVVHSNPVAFQGLFGALHPRNQELTILAINGKVDMPNKKAPRLSSPQRGLLSVFRFDPEFVNYHGRRSKTR